MNSVQQRNGSVSVGPPIVLILKIHLGRALFSPQFLPFTLPLCCSKPYHKPSQRLGDVTSTPPRVWFIELLIFFIYFFNICRLVGSSTAGLWTSSHTAFVFICVSDLCSYAGCCRLVSLGDMRPGCDITGEERQKAGSRVKPTRVRLVREITIISRFS